MSITIAGKPVVIDHQCQLKEFLETRLPPEEILFSRWHANPARPNTLACDNAPDYIDSPYPPLPRLSIGELQWPTGASRYARALYVVDWLTMRKIAEDAWGWEPETELIDPEGDPEDPENQQEVPLTDVPEDWGTEFYEVELKIAGEETFTANMFPLRPYRVTGNGIDLWLLPLVDVRWKWVHKAYEPDETPPEDMETFIESVATAAGATITVDDIAIAGSVDPRLWKAEQPAANIIDIACLSSGLRAVRDPSGQLRAISQANSDTRRQARLAWDWKILSGGRRGPDVLPSSVRVHCRKKNKKFHVESTNIPGGTSVGGTPLAVWSSWFKTDDNGAATTAFAEDVAQSIADWSDCGGQYSLVGPVNFVPTGYDDFVSISLEERSPGEYIFRTTVRELPGVFLPRAILVGGQDDDCCDGNHFLFTLLENMSVSQGAAEIRTMDDTEQVEASAIVKNTLGHFSELETGDRGICVKVNGIYYAIHPDGGEGSGGGEVPGVVFSLTTDLAGSFAATATATVIISGASGIETFDVITVYNTGQKRSWTGAAGFAILINDQFWVVEVDQYPILSVVTFSDDTHNISGAGLDQGSTATQQTISVSSFDPLSPYPFGFLPDPLPEIENPYNLLGLAGDHGIVVYNPSAEEAVFQLIEVLPNNKRRLAFRLTANMPSTTVSSTEDFEVLETREFTAGDVVGPSSISDPLGLIIGGRNLDQGVIEYSYRDQAWHVVSFRRRPVQLRVDGMNWQISHDGGNTWTTWATGSEDCPSPTP